MKNYELVARLMELPAGYDVAYCRTVLKEEMGDLEALYICEEVEDADIDHVNKKITLMMD